MTGQSTIPAFPAGITQRMIKLPSGLNMEVFEGGQGAAVLLVHGFPDLAWTWRYQLENLLPDYHVIAPNMRGYGQTDAPSDWRKYSTQGHLVEDIRELLDTLDISQAHLVGHDLGGHVVWHFAQCHPTRITSLTTINCPHPKVFSKALRTWKQLKKSWYMFFFQLPNYPEDWVRKDPVDFVHRIYRKRAINKKPFTDENLQPYIDQVTMRGLQGGINYYRARLRIRNKVSSMIEVPTKLIWALNDPFLASELADPSNYTKYVRNFEVDYLDNAGHWAHQEQPEQTNQKIRNHLATVDPQGG